MSMNEKKNQRIGCLVVLFIGFGIYNLFSSKYSGSYTDSFGMTSIEFKSDKTISNAIYDCKWEEIDNGVRVFDCNRTGWGRDQPDRLTGVWKEARNGNGDFCLTKDGLTWVKD